MTSHSRTRTLQLSALVGVLMVCVVAGAMVIPNASIPRPDTSTRPSTLSAITDDIQQLFRDRAAGIVSRKPRTYKESEITEENVIQAGVLTFEQQARLVTFRRANDLPLRIIADELQIGEGAVLTWASLSQLTLKPPPRGKAPDGYAGRAEGEPGGRGIDGEPGNPGLNGSSAPTIKLVVGKVTGGTLTVDLRGQQGGPGGDGQNGGNGGAGAKGRAAIDSAVSCARAGADGGAGGKGGAGGPPGLGGLGGDGGTFVLVTPDANAKTHFKVFATGGAAGAAGKAGEPGKGGAAGEAGTASILCGGGNVGTPGPAGESPPPLTAKGSRVGLDGVYSEVILEKDVADKVFVP
jgi:hypothetical protein